MASFTFNFKGLNTKVVVSDAPGDSVCTDSKGHTTVTLGGIATEGEGLGDVLETACAALYKIGLAVSYTCDETGELRTMMREQKRFGRSSSKSITLDVEASPSEWEFKYRENANAGDASFDNFPKLLDRKLEDGGLVTFELGMKGH